MKLVRFIGIVVCLWLNTTIGAVSYSSHCSMSANYVPPDAHYKSDNAVVAQTPQITFRSTSTMPVFYNNVKALNTDGTVSMAYTTYGRNNAPKRARKGLDLDDEDEPTGGLVPVGDIPWGFILFLILVFFHFRKGRWNDRLTHANSMQKSDKKATTLAYLKKKLYLCTRIKNQP